jgi:hypothetical protein
VWLWFANIRFSANGLTFIAFQSKTRGSMPTLILFLFRFARLLFSGHAAVAVENAALRPQLGPSSDNGDAACPISGL